MNSDYLKLADIAYEQIVGKFWYGHYGQFRVVMMKDCGFINATKLCSDGGKDLKHFLFAKLFELLSKQTQKKQFQARTTIHSSFHTLAVGYHQILQSSSAILSMIS